jgi:serine/threonine protein phosphatase PrpC
MDINFGVWQWRGKRAAQQDDFILSHAPAGILMGVFDGVGEEADGAARLATAAVRRKFAILEADLEPKPLLEGLVKVAAEATEKTPGATTCLLVHYRVENGGQFHLAQAGDSLAFVEFDETLHLVGTPHNLAHDRIEGSAPSDEITRWLGKGSILPPVICQCSILPNEHLWLLTDGSYETYFSSAKGEVPMEGPWGWFSDRVRKESEFHDNATAICFSPFHLRGEDARD